MPLYHINKVKFPLIPLHRPDRTDDLNFQFVPQVQGEQVFNLRVHKVCFDFTVFRIGQVEISTLIEADIIINLRPVK